MNKPPYNYCLLCGARLVLSPNCSKWYQVFNRTIKGPHGIQGGRLVGYCHRVCPRSNRGGEGTPVK